MIFFYHTCIRCGRKVNPARLEILPETRLCKECAEKVGSDITIRPTRIGMDLDTYKDLLRATRS